MQWTAHLQAVPPPPPPAPPTAVVVQQPYRVDPYANRSATPYGVGTGYPNQGFVQVPMQQVHQQHNSAAVASVVVGALAFTLSLVGLLPGSPIFYYSAGGVFAIIGGARALARRRQGFGTDRKAPIAAIILGSLAVVFMITGILIHVVGTEVANTNYTSGTTSNAAPQVSGGSNVASATVPAAPTFAADAELTAYEKTAGDVALDVDKFANGGYAFADNPNWPAALTVTSDGTILLPPGTSPGTLPAGQEMRYVLSGDAQSFDIYVTGGTHDEIAIYDSSTNSFTWTCDDSDASCPPGGLTPDPGNQSSTTTNS